GEQVDLDPGRGGVDPAQAPRAREQLGREMEAEEDLRVGEGRGQLVVLGDADELDARKARLGGAQLVVAHRPANLLDPEVENGLHRGAAVASAAGAAASSSARRRVIAIARPCQSTPMSASTTGCW